MAKIKSITARQIINSAGLPTIEASTILTDGAVGIASYPTGIAAGGYEAATIQDNDTAHYGGHGVGKAIENIETIIAPKLLGFEATKQQEIDKIMIDLDGTQNKSKLGANAILPVSISIAKAAALSSVLPLYLYLRNFIPSSQSLSLKIPTPLFTLISSGIQDKTGLDFEDYFVIPATSKPYSESLEMGEKLLMNLEEYLKSNNLLTPVGMTGGFTPPLTSNREALEVLKKIAESTSYKYGLDVFLGVDGSATKFYKNQQYNLKERNQIMSSKTLISYYQALVKDFNLLYLEDPLSEDDWDGWTEAVKQLAQITTVVGDDLTATNLYRLQMAIVKKAITGIVIKPTQIGTVIESLAVVEVARSAGLKIIVSQRAQETDDDFIADFSVAVSADYVKFGPPLHGEHVAKYNRLLQIEQQLKKL